MSLSTEFRPATAADLPEIIELLRAAFDAPADAPFLDPKLLHWKYFDPGLSPDTPRSYMMLQNGRLIAHGCAWPVKLAISGRIYETANVVDWAGSKAALGSGFQLMMKMAAGGPVFAIAGSDVTRAMMPRMGFKNIGEQLVYARVLRPLKQFLTRPRANFAKELARLARNSGYRMSSKAATNGWSARPSETLEASPAFQQTPASGPATIHDPEFLRFMTRCPAAEVRSFELLKETRPAGHLLLSRVHGQSRIAELRIAGEDLPDWKSAFSAAVDAAAQSPEACELVALAATPLVKEALEANGFRLRDKRPVRILDRNRVLPETAGPWDVGMLDDDMPYMNIPSYPYFT